MIRSRSANPVVAGFLAAFVVGWLGWDNVCSAGAAAVVRYAAVAEPSSVFHSYWVIADKLGWFAEEGVRAEVIRVPNPLSSVAAGQSDFGIGQANTLLVFMAENPDADLVAVFATGMQWTNKLVVRKGSGIKEFRDLKGKRIGVIGPGSSTWWVLDAAAKVAGLRQQDFTRVIVPPGAALAEAFRRGVIDAGSYEISQVMDLEEALGESLEEVPLPMGLEKLGGPVLVGRRDLVSKNRERYAGYFRALSKAFVFAGANPRAAMEMHLDAFPSLQRPGETRAEALDRLVAYFEARYAVSGPPAWAKDRPWGWNLQESWEPWVPILPQLAGKKVELSRLMTNELVELASRFDRQPILDLAARFPR